MSWPAERTPLSSAPEASVAEAEAEETAREADCVALLNQTHAHLQAATTSVRRLLQQCVDEESKRKVKALLRRLDNVALDAPASYAERILLTRIQAVRARQAQSAAALAARASAVQELRQLAEDKLALEAELAERELARPRRETPNATTPPPLPSSISPPPLPRSTEPTSTEPAVWSNEHRGAPRIALQAAVDFASDTNLYTGFSTNLSEGGLFIATVEHPPLGALVDLSFTLPGGQIIHAEGEVRWVRDYRDDAPSMFPGVGVKFRGLTTDDSLVLREFVSAREPMFYPD